MSQQYTTSLIINAALGASFLSTFQRGSAEVHRLGEVARSASKDQAALGQTALATTAPALVDVGRLGAGYRVLGTTLRATTTQQWNFNRIAVDGSQRHLGEITRLRAELGKLRGDYDKLTQSVGQLGAKQRQVVAAATADQRRAALDQRGAELRGGAFGTLALTGGLMLPAKVAGDFQDSLRDISITGELGRGDEMRLGQVMRRAALDYNQNQADVAHGVNVLVQTGLNAREAGSLAPLLAKAATATRAEMADLGKTIFSLSEVLEIKGEAGLKEALNRAAFGAKAGSFEFKAIAGALPEIAAGFKAFGIKGQSGLSEIIASLEVGKKFAGTDGEATTNLRNWLSHMTAKHTAEAFGKQGIDYKASMQDYVGRGVSAYEASIDIARRFIESKVDIKTLQTEMKHAGNDEGRQALLQRFGLSEIFQDIQTVNHLLAMLQGRADYEKIKAGMGTDEAKGTIDRDFQRRMDTFKEQSKAARIAARDLGIALGESLLPTIGSLLGHITPLVQGVGQWVEKHPRLTALVVGTTTALVAYKVATIAAGYASLFFQRAQLASAAGAALFRTRLLGTAAAMRGMNATALMMGAGATMSALRTHLVGAGAGLAAFGGRIGAVARGALPMMLGALRALSVGLLTTPIGWIATAVAGAGFLIWKYWAPLKAFFSGFWAGLSSSLRPVGAAVTSALRPLGVVVQTVWRQVSPVVQPLLGAVRRLWAGLFSQAGAGGAAGVGERLGQLLGNRLAETFGWLRRFVNFGVRFGAGLASGVRAVVGPVLGAVTGLARSVGRLGAGMLEGLFPAGAARKAAAGLGVLWQAVRPVLGFLVTAFQRGRAVIGFGVTWIGTQLGRLVGMVRGWIAQIDPHALGRMFGRMLGEMALGWVRWPARMFQLGVQAITGLVNGIKSLAARPAEIVGSIGQAVRDKFASVLGIRSPSRVFAGYGANIVEGLTMGVDGARRRAASTGERLAHLLGSPSATTGSGPSAGMRRSGAMGSAITLSYSPNITITGQTSEIDFAKLLREHSQELFRQLDEYQRRQARKAY